MTTFIGNGTRGGEFRISAWERQIPEPRSRKSEMRDREGKRAHQVNQEETKTTDTGLPTMSPIMQDSERAKGLAKETTVNNKQSDHEARESGPSVIRDAIDARHLRI